MKLRNYLISTIPTITGYIILLTREKTTLYSILLLSTVCGMFTMGYAIKLIDKKEIEEKK